MSADTLMEYHLRPGALVAEKYEVQRVLGEGGVGIVVAARHIHLNRDVALKFLKPGTVDAHERAELFANEARATFDIVSDHIVRVLDLDRLADDTPFMVMELLEGCDLRKLFDEGSVFEASAVIELGRQICSGLSAAHALGVVHRDIKPENIFVIGPGAEVQFKLLDFGISRSGEQAPRDPGRVPLLSGTPAYMSPEQVRDAELDQRSDVWSLGCVMYEMLTSIAPFQRDTPTHSCHAVLQEQPRALRALRPDLDERLERIVMRCLSKDVADRYGNAEQLQQALDALPRTAAASLKRVRAPQNDAAAVNARTTVNMRVPRGVRMAASALVGAALGVSAARYAASTEEDVTAPRISVVQPRPIEAPRQAPPLDPIPSGITPKNTRKPAAKPVKVSRAAQSPEPDVGF